MTRVEICDTWMYRLFGLLVSPFIGDKACHPNVKEIGRDLLHRIYDSLTKPSFPPPDDYLEEYEPLGRLVALNLQTRKLDFIAASMCLDEVYVTTMKQLHAVLRKHPEIRWEKPCPQRLMINAADWKRFIADRERQAGDALDAADEFAGQSRQRRDRLRVRRCAQ